MWGFALDSREVKKGDLFIALEGERVDGHDFLEEAFANGASAALIKKGVHTSFPHFAVDNPVLALQQLATDELAKRGQRIIAVTGSVGKTTTKEFLFDLISGSFSIAKSPGNRNSQVGLPQSILEADPEAEFLLLEMGMTDRGHIEKLVSIAPPEIAIITKIGTAHMDLLGSQEAIAHAKGEIFSHSLTKLAVLAAEDLEKFPFLRKKTNAEFSTFSKNNGDLTFSSNKSEVILTFPNHEKITCILPFATTHFHYNFAGAALVAFHLGVSPEEIVQRAGSLKGFKRRFELVEKEGVSFLNDCYNANLEAFAAAMENLPANIRGKKIGVIGHMPELGCFSEQAHRELASIIAPHFDFFLCIGEQITPTVEELEKKKKNVEVFATFSDLEHRFSQVASSGDFAYIKGANTLQLWRLAEDSLISS